MIHVLAHIVAKPGERARILEIMLANRPAVLAEDGCLGYEPAIDLEGAGPIQTPLGPDAFMVVERWADLAALKAHAAAPHMKAYAEATRDLVASRTIHVLTPDVA